MIKYAFTDVRDGSQYRVAKVIENESGYYPLGKANPDDPHELDKFVGDRDHVRIIVDNMNKHMGVSKERERQIRLTTF